MSDPSTDVDARYDQIAASRAASGDLRRPLTRAESLALVDLLGGALTDDDDPAEVAAATSRALQALGAADTSAA